MFISNKIQRKSITNVLCDKLPLHIPFMFTSLKVCVSLLILVIHKLSGCTYIGRRFGFMGLLPDT